MRARPKLFAQGLVASHVLVLGVVADVEREQYHRLVAQILPPVRRTARFPRHLTGLVDDRIDAIVAVFDDLAFEDVDQRRPIIVAVPAVMRIAPAPV